MKQIPLLGYLSLLFILSTALTCTGHRDLPHAARFRVKTVKSSQVNFTHVLTYDSTGRLASYTGPRSDSFADGSTSYDYRRYGQAGGKYDFRTIRSPTKFQATVLYYKFDDQRRLIQVRYIDTVNGGGGVGLVLLYDYIYTDNNTFPLSRITTRFVDNGNTIVGSKTEIYSFAGGNATTVDGKLFTYDTSPNPYKGLLGFNEWYYSSPDFSTDSDVTSLNRPFIISERFSDSSVKIFNQNNRTTNAQLTYNSDGLVTKILYDDGRSEEFTYETDCCSNQVR